MNRKSMKTTNSTSQKLGEALRQRQSLQTQLDAVEHEIKAAEARLGDSFREVADGAELSADGQRELANLVAKRLLLRAMLGKSEQALAAAERRAFARGVITGADAMSALLRERFELAKLAEVHLKALANLLGKMCDNGTQIFTSYRSLRGRDAQTSKGIVAVDLEALHGGGNLQFLVSVDLAGRTGWWHEPNRPPWGAKWFADGVQDATVPLRSEWEELTGLSSLARSDVEAVRADLKADGYVAQITQMVTAGEGELDNDAYNEALVNAIPDINIEEVTGHEDPR